MSSSSSSQHPYGDLAGVPLPTGVDIGCGATKQPGCIGVDIVPLQGVDVVADLADGGYPFATGTFDDVYLNDVIEHFADTVATMEEIHRICRPGARVHIRVVNWNSQYSDMDPTHKRHFTEHSFDFFGAREGRSYYTHARFDVVRVRYQYNAFAQRLLQSRVLLKFLSLYLSNVLEGLHFDLRAVKTSADGRSISTRLEDVLRCPACSPQTQADERSALSRISESWLGCRNCGARYPIYGSVPVLLASEAARWRGVADRELPRGPDSFERTDVAVKARPPDVPDPTYLERAITLEALGSLSVRSLLRRALLRLFSLAAAPLRRRSRSRRQTD